MFQQTGIFEKLNYLSGITRTSVLREMQVGNSCIYDTKIPAEQTQKIQ